MDFTTADSTIYKETQSEQGMHLQLPDTDTDKHI